MSQHHKTVAASSFQKVPGSNPSQVRAQFMNHMTTQDNQSSINTQASPTLFKLRPIKQVLNKLRHDPAYEVKDYVVGYIDRQAGILEKLVDEWGDREDESTVAYVKCLPEDRVVWDRIRKIDRIFNSGPEEVTGT